MKILQKTLLISASLILVAGAGCTQPATTSLDTDNSNETVVNTTVTNTNEAVVENINAVLDNTNTATSNTNESDGEITDTSDWLSYTNEEYGFSFRYPKDWTYEEKSLTAPEEGILSVRFLSPADSSVINSINYTDQPVGIDVRIIESSLSPLQYYQEQIGSLDIQYSEAELESGLMGVAYHDPGLSEGIYRNIFSNGDNQLIDVRIFSKKNLESETFITFMKSLEFYS